LAFACGRNVSTAPATSPDNENAVVSSSSLPASIFEKSSTSSMMRTKACAESRIVATSGSWSSPNPCRSKTSIMPSTPFIGVRISWLIVARNVDFASFAASASARAASAASVRSRSCEISRAFSIANADWLANVCIKRTASGGNSPAARRCKASVPRMRSWPTNGTISTARKPTARLTSRNGALGRSSRSAIWIGARCAAA
jgi:hypothetical protein